jgi:hypothetical protein
MRVRVIVAGYSEEQLRRKAHLDRGGTIANYDRSHYKKYGITIDTEVKNDTGKTNNSNGRE